MDNPRDIEPLIEALTHPDKREDAAYTLGKLSDPRAVEPLKAAYAAALVGGNPQKTIAPFFADSYGTARDIIIQALAKIGSCQATETLLIALHDPGLYIQDSACWGLGKLGDHRAIQPLLKRLLENHDINTIQPLLEIGGKQVLEEFYRVLTSPEFPSYLRSDIARAFKAQARPVPDILFHSFQNAEVLEERCEIIEILGTSGDPRVFPMLLALLNNPQENLLVHRAVIGILYECDQNQAVDPLLTLLTNNSSHIIRALAAQALSVVDQPEVITALCEALHDEAASVRASAAGSLALRNDPRIIPALEAMIAREVLHKDDLQAYERDKPYFFAGTYPSFFQSPKECAQESINFIRA